MPTGMEGSNMSKREELRAEVKAEREKVAEAHEMAADPSALLAKVAELRARAREARVRVSETTALTQEEQSFKITPKMRADARRAEARDRRLSPDAR